MIISIVNHKGGTGKTTTTINLGSALALRKQRVLLIDFDAQGNLTYSLGIDEHLPTTAEALLGEVDPKEVLIEREGMHVMPGGPKLANLELSIANSEERYHHLKELIASLGEYDFVLIDCPPSISLLTLNALCTSDQVIIPMQLDVLALRGLELILRTITKVKSTLHAELEIGGVLPVMVDSRKNLNKEILEYIRSNYDVPVYPHFIRPSVKAAEAPSFGKSVLRYAPTCSSAEDYSLFAATVYKKSQHSISKTIN